MAPKLLGRKLELLQGTAARQLFRQCAGREGAVDAGPADLEGGVISACGGLPLALELAGRFLREEGSAAGWQVCGIHGRDHGGRAFLATSAWGATGLGHLRFYVRRLMQREHPTHPVLQAMLMSLKGEGTGLPNATTEERLRGVLGSSFNTLSLAAQSMVGADAWCFLGDQQH